MDLDKIVLKIRNSELDENDVLKYGKILIKEYAKTRCCCEKDKQYAVVRWHENQHEDVVCIDKKTALEYVEKYNKLCAEEKCYLDEEIWLPLKKARKQKKTN